tara:strand:- start:996 stop:1667 length:672 start_codon:yes stop_codon:yes gene_type:complete
MSNPDKLALELYNEIKDDLTEFSENDVKEYCRFLALKAITDDGNSMKLSPSPQLDQIWHYHLISTASYQKTMKILGTMIHHDPRKADDSIEVKECRYKATFKEYLDNFGESFVSRSMWPIFYPGSKRDLERKKKIKELKEFSKNSGEQLAIFVRGLNGKSGVFYLNPDTTIDELKMLMHEEDIFPINPRLVFCGRRLEDDKTLKDYNIINESMIHCTLNLRGC